MAPEDMDKTQLEEEVTAFENNHVHFVSADMRSRWLERLAGRAKNLKEDDLTRRLNQLITADQRQAAHV